MWSVVVQCGGKWSIIARQVQQRSDHKPQVQELERKLKVLQTRFDRQKQQIDSLRQQQKV